MSKSDEYLDLDFFTLGFLVTDALGFSVTVALGFFVDLDLDDDVAL
jgi:hypothetical protein